MVVVMAVVVVREVADLRGPLFWTPTRGSTEMLEF